MGLHRAPYFKYVYLFAYLRADVRLVHHGMHVELKGQALGVILSVRRQVPLPTGKLLFCFIIVRMYVCM